MYNRNHTRYKYLPLSNQNHCLATSISLSLSLSPVRVSYGYIIICQSSKYLTRSHVIISTIGPVSGKSIMA